MKAAITVVLWSRSCQATVTKPVDISSCFSLKVLLTEKFQFVLAAHKVRKLFSAPHTPRTNKLECLFLAETFRLVYFVRLLAEQAVLGVPFGKIGCPGITRKEETL